MKQKHIFSIIIYFVMIPKVYAIDYQNICNNNDVINTFRILGEIINIIKIVIPLIIIVLGMVDFSKAIISSDEKAINKATGSIIRRIIAGVLIYFVPTIILSLFNALGYDTYNSPSFIKCSSCLFDTTLCTVDESLIPQEDEDKIEENENGTYHKNSINKRKFMIYEQMDSRWSNLPYLRADGTGTIGERGCNIIAGAVIASGFDNTITPYEIYNTNYRSNHPYIVINNITNNQSNCYYSHMSQNEIINNLKQGNVAVILVYGPVNGGNSKFTPEQHYISIIDISSDGNQIYIGNSYDNGTHYYSKSGWFNTDEVLTSVQQVHMCEI